MSTTRISGPRARPTLFSSVSLSARRSARMHDCTLQRPFIHAARLHSSCTAQQRPQPRQRMVSQQQNKSIDNARHASTSTSPSAAAASAQATANPTVLTWNDFFKLRQRRRYFHLVASVTGAGGSLASGMSFLSQLNPDMLGFAGMDPLIMMALMSIGCGVGGWLIGPVVGSGLFRVFNRGASEMGKKEKDFYARIKKYRIDPSSSSMQNPVPDYYGEKITSVAGYRQWLKDQRAFNKKRQSFL